MNSDLDLLNLARTAAASAADFIRTAERPDPTSWSTKGLNDFVTDVDRKSEDMIRGILLSAALGSSFLGEESSPDGALAGLVWVVDPLDGTTNFLHGYPWYAVSIAAAVDGEVRAGVVRHVVTDDEYYAAKDHGAYHGQRRLTVSTIVDPAHALLGTGFPFKYPEMVDEYLEQFRHLMPRTSGIRRAGSAALDLADVAAGRLDGFWELALAPWDIAAGTLLVREAGGRVTDREGCDVGVAHTAVVAGNPAMLDWLLAQMTA